MPLKNTGLRHKFIPLCVLQHTNKNNKHTKSFRGRHLDFRADFDAIDVALHEELRRGCELRAVLTLQVAGGK